MTALLETLAANEKHQTKAEFDLKLIIGWGEHKMVLDKSGFRAYCVGVDCVLNFLSVYGWPCILRRLARGIFWFSCSREDEHAHPHGRC